MVFGVRSQFRCAAPVGRAEGAGNLGSDPENARSRFVGFLSEALLLNCGWNVAAFRCRSVAAAGDQLSFASPKESRQRKGDPGVCVPPLRCGHLAVLASSGVELELAALKQSLALIRLKLRSSAHSQGFCREGADSDSGPGSCRAAATNSIAACARITWARGQKHLNNRRAA